MNPFRAVSGTVVLFVLTSFFCSAAYSQISDSWVVFLDYETDAECGVINTSNADLILLESTYQLAVISGQDTILLDTYVDENDEVFVNDEPAGYVDFLTDADGYRAMFWTTFTGSVVEIDGITGEPWDSGYLPEELSSTGCNACESLDSSPYCAGVVAPDFSSIMCGAGTPASLGFSLFALPMLYSSVRRR